MIRQFWAELNTPDTFHADPYGGGMNQLGHIALGAFFSGLAYVVVGVLFGEMPYKVAMLASMLFLYGGVIEWQVQGSSLKDGARTVCAGVGSSEYTPEETRQKNMPLSAFVGEPCNLPTGEYTLYAYWHPRDDRRQVQATTTFEVTE
jgi:hypothetical protein